MRSSRACWTIACLFVAALFLLSACIPELAPAAPTQAPPTATHPPAGTAMPTLALSTPLVAPTSIVKPSATTTILTVLPPEPQAIRFTASDEQALSGTYYPAAVNPSPVIVLMHWAKGNETDWDTIAAWLQNRGTPSRTRTADPWQDSAWFPALPKSFTIGVFTFSFRNCLPQSHCPDSLADQWLLDARAAVEVAATLPGVNPAHVVVAGASIGGDGAADGCFLANRAIPGSCQGALSFSPGNYLGASYKDAVRELQQSGLPTWCLADSREIGVCKAAYRKSYTAYKIFEFPGGGHGMELLSPKVDPSAMQTLLNFIQLTTGVS